MPPAFNRVNGDRQLSENMESKAAVGYTPDWHKMKIELRGFLAQGKEVGSAHSRNLCAGSVDAELRQKERNAAEFYAPYRLQPPE